MKGNSELANKVNEVSMPVSPSVLAGIRKKRTPFYIAKNHIGLHKVRYGVVGSLLLLLAISPFVISTNDSGAESVYVKEDARSTELVKEESGEVVAADEGREGVYEDVQKSSEIYEEINSSNLANSNQKEVNQVNESQVDGEEIGDKEDRGGKKLEESPQGKYVLENSSRNGDSDVANKDQKVEDKVEGVELQFESADLEELKMDKVQIAQIPNDMIVEDVAKVSVPDGFGGDIKRLGFTSVGVNYGVFADKIIIEQNGNSEKLRNALSSKATSTIGLELEMPIFKGLNLRTGVSYLSRKENFSYLNQSTNYVLKIDTVNGVIHIPGQPSKNVVRYDSSYINDGKHVQMDKVNKVSYIELPVLFSYTVWSNQKLALNASAGMRFGMLQNVEGYSFNKSNEVVTLSNSNNIVYKKALISTAELSLDLDYVLSDRWNVFVQPTVRRGIGSVSTSNMGYSHNYTMYGVVTGLRMRL